MMSSEQACNPRTQRLRYEDHKFEAQPLLHSEFVASLSYLETRFKTKTRKKSTPIGYSIPYGQPEDIHTSEIIRIEQVIFRNVYIYNTHTYIYIDMQ